MSSVQTRTREEIRARMCSIRKRMPSRIDSVKRRVNLATDWKYYLGRHPWLALAGAAATVYALVPSAKASIAPVQSPPVPDAPKSSSILSIVTGTLTNLAIRSAMAWAISQMTAWSATSHSSHTTNATNDPEPSFQYSSGI